jgi:acetyl-CoA carboxylase carboxyl transferase subunit alpha
VRLLMSDFVELHGDRKFADDPAVVAGFAQFRGRPVAVIGHQKGRDTKQKVLRNFGMPRPEGYRKALRVMDLAEKFGRPILTFIDTPGAYPGLGAEERGQAEAIAYNLKRMAAVQVPIVVTVTGEGGSGGALAIGVGDRILMLEFATYSVISPEACSAILFKSSERAAETAESLRLTAPDLMKHGIIDVIVPEPTGGAHGDPAEAARLLEVELARALEESSAWSVGERLQRRYEKFRRLGSYLESADDAGRRDGRSS